MNSFILSYSIRNYNFSRKKPAPRKQKKQCVYTKERYPIGYRYFYALTNHVFAQIEQYRFF